MVTLALMSAFVVELIVGGPGFWQIGGISLRRTLVTAVTAWLLLLCLLGRCRLRSGHVLLLLSISLFLAVWMLVLPGLHDERRLGHAFQEGFPLALAWTGTLAHAYFVDNPAAWARLRLRAGAALALVAAVSILLWVVGALLVESPLIVVLGVLAFFTAGNTDLEPALYVQVMPDGFFRVMWITSVLFPVGLLYCLQARRVAGVWLFALALFVTYTRALWLVAVIGVLIWFFLSRGQRARPRHRPARLVVAALMVAALAVFDLGRGAESSALHSVVNRVGASASDQSADERIEQIQPLLDAWLSAPVLGHGLGSAAPGSERSDVSPFLYELTYLALLMKTGIVGLSMLLALAAALWLRQRVGAQPAHVHASIVAFLLASGTNPYLLNLVGLGLLCFLFIERDLHGAAIDVEVR